MPLPFLMDEYPLEMDYTKESHVWNRLCAGDYFPHDCTFIVVTFYVVIFCVLCDISFSSGGMVLFLALVCIYIYVADQSQPKDDD